MIFKPTVVPCMWDTWLYYYRGTHYLFFLLNTREDARWDGIGMAVSDDGVHFTDLGPIIHKADDVKWLGTGMTWRVGDRFLVNFSENRRDRQEIHFAESTDMRHWQRLPNEEYVCRSDPRWYADAPQAFSPHRWDCIWVMPREEGQGYVGFLTAVARDGPPGLRGTCGYVVSDDGLHFRAAPPVVETGLWGDVVEIGGVEKIASRYYMLLNVYNKQPLGARHLSRLMAGELGMYPLTSDAQDGPYRLRPNQAPLLASSPVPYTAFARFYRYGDEMLLNHHTVPRTFGKIDFNGGVDVCFSPLKAVRAASDGALTLRWWLGNEALKGVAYPVGLDSCAFHGLQAEDRLVEEGTLNLRAISGGLAVLPIHFNMARGVILEAFLSVEEASGPISSVGLFIEGRTAHAGTVILAQSDNRLTVGSYTNWGAFSPEDAKPLPPITDRPRHWRLLVRDVFIEVYLDDELIQCYTLTHQAAGRLGFVVEASRVSIKDVRAWEMSL